MCGGVQAIEETFLRKGTKITNSLIGYLPHLIQPIKNTLYACESHGKGVRKSAPKKLKYHAGVAVNNLIAGLRQANCSHSEILTLNAEEIPISLSAIKRIGQCFETTGNVARKKGSRRPKASSCRDDHLLKFTVLKNRKRSLQKLSAEFKTLENKTISRKAITRRLSNAGVVSRRCIKKPLLSQTSDRIIFLPEYGKFDSEWFSRVVWSDESRFQLHVDLQRAVFEYLVRNTIVNASLQLWLE